MVAHNFKSNIKNWDFQDGGVVQKPPGNAEDTGMIPGSGRFHNTWSN